MALKTSQVVTEGKEDNNNLLDNLCLFTSTFYKDNDKESVNRSQLALDFISNAHALGIKVVISDGSPLQEGESMSPFEKNVRAIIQDNSNITIIRTTKRLSGGTTSTMADERKQALEEGLAKHKDVSHFLWIEPEKGNLVTKESLTTLMNTAQNTHADFVIPTRKQLAETLSQHEEPSGMHTLPKFQARTETRANEALWKGTGESHDSYFGPVLLKKGTGTEQYLNSPYPTWGINVLTPIEGKNAGLKVVDAPVDYSYDPVQQTFEDGETDALGNPIDPEVGELQSDFYKGKRVDQYMKIVYAGQKPEDVFSTYHKNIISSEEKFVSLSPEKKEEMINHLYARVKELHALCQISINLKSGKLYEAMIHKVGDDDKVDSYYGSQLMDLMKISSQGLDGAYTTLKKLYVKFNPLVYNSPVESQMSLATIESYPIFKEDSDVQTFEKRLQTRENKRK